MPALITSDNVSNINTGSVPQWGIFLDNVSVVKADTVTSFEYKQDWSLLDYPVEQGGFETYNKVKLPFEVMIELTKGGTEAELATFLSSISAIAGDFNIYSVVAGGAATYPSVNISHYDYRRTALNGVSMIKVSVKCTQIIVNSKPVYTQTTTISSQTPSNTYVVNSPSVTNSAVFYLNNPSSPYSSSPVNDGTVQPNSMGATSMTNSVTPITSDIFK